MDVLSFEEAISDSAQCSKRHLLLGNGFSIACRPDIFHYGSLYDAADFSTCPQAQKAFDTLNTKDFEAVIKSLEAAAKLAPIYNSLGIEAAKQMVKDASALKEILLATIAGNHPDVPSDIPNNKFWWCRKFLSNFLSGSKGGQVFTLNYDLLLYWTLMHEDDPLEDPTLIEVNDGFGNDESDPMADYVVWHGEVGAHSARVHFLHGALHLYDAGSELQKYTWIRTNDRLIDQARKAIDSNKFPLFVAEGTTGQKKNKIRHNAYLYQGFKQFTANALQGQHCFFIHGHSLAENDDHFLIRLGKGKFKKIYVSLFGDPDSGGNKKIIKRTEHFASLRNAKYPLSVAFYDAESARIWG